MKAYTPVVIGESPALRESVENLLSPCSDSIGNRLEELDVATTKDGNPVNFGAELEFQFIDDPTVPKSSDRTTQWMYEDVVMAFLGTNEIGQRVWGKGDVILPGDNPNAIMLSEKCSDQGGEIIEVRTSPASALEAIEHYWRVAQAVGAVAQAHGKMGLILNSHLSTAIQQEDVNQPFVPFHDLKGGAILANIQQNVQAVNALQIDTGLETGVSIQEAYPTKDASTSVHSERLEFRHGSVGVVDPRIEMLATLSGVRQYQLGDTQTAQRQLRASSIYRWSGPYDDLNEVMNDCLLVDNKTNRIVTPAMLDFSARATNKEWAFNSIGRHVTHDSSYTIMSDNGDAVRIALAGLPLEDADEFGWRSIRPDYSANSPLVARLPLSRGIYLDTIYRTLPHVTFDSPQSHALRRHNIAQSSTVRRIMGRSIGKLTRADDALAIRKDLIDSTMVVSDGPTSLAA